jgi:hypothetical protein
MNAGDAAQPGPLAELVRHIERTRLSRTGTPVADSAAGAAGAAGGALDPGDLRYFRRTWSRLRVERQLTRSQAQVPENAGPLNSDRLVLRALQTLRELSPDYLNRYMAYVDTLMWLDQAQIGMAAAPALHARADNDKKRKPGRARPGKAASIAPVDGTDTPE